MATSGNNFWTLVLFLMGLQALLILATPVPPSMIEERKSIKNMTMEILQLLTKNFYGSLRPSNGFPQLRGLHGPKNGSSLTCKVLGKMYCLTTLNVTFLSSTHYLNKGLQTLHQHTQSLMEKSPDCTCSLNTMQAKQLNEAYNLLQLYDLWMNTTIPFSCHKMELSKVSC